MIKRFIGTLKSDSFGVFAIEVTGFQLILAAIGDVVVLEYSLVANPGNFRDIVYNIRAFGEDESPLNLNRDMWIEIIYEME